VSDTASLTFVDPDEQDNRYRICLWAQAGAGKTVAACSAPGPIVAVSADRPGAYRYARRHHHGKQIREVRFEGAHTLELVYRYLKQTPEVRTVVLDPFGAIYDAMVSELGGAEPKGPHYQRVNKRLLDFLITLRALDLNVILVAHERVEGDEDSGIQRMPALGGPKMIEKTLAEMDIVAWCYRMPQEDGPDKFMGQLVNARGRTCKDSTNALGRTRELDVSEWIEAANGDLYGNDSDLPWADDVTNQGVEDEPAQQELAA
jgi:hypothetical protein